jgi:hypothetical protein
VKATLSNLQFAFSNLQFAISRTLGTALLEVRLNVLSPPPWVIGLVLGALGYVVVRTSTDASSFRLGWALSHDYGPLTVLLLLFLAAGFAHRPQRYELTELQDSKTVASEELIFGRWLGMVAGVMVPLIIQYGVTMAGQQVHSQAAVVPAAYLQSLARLLPSVLFLTTLSFCLVTLTRVLVLGAGLAGLLWFALYFGTAYYGSVFRIELTQNRLVFFGLAASALSLMLLGYRGRRRAKRALATRALALLTGLLFTATMLHAAWASLALPGKARAAAAAKRLQGDESPEGLRTSYRKGEPLPNFAWPDLHDRRVSLAGLRGKPALLVFFQPGDDGLVPLLQRLSALPDEFNEEELQVLGICLSEDLRGIRDAARLARASIPIVTDWGSPGTERFNPKQPSSVVAWLLEVRGTPAALLVDAEGREVTRGIPLAEAGWKEMQDGLRDAIRGEPQEERPSEEELLRRVLP